MCTFQWSPCFSPSTGLQQYLEGFGVTSLACEGLASLFSHRRYGVALLPVVSWRCVASPFSAIPLQWSPGVLHHLLPHFSPWWQQHRTHVFRSHPIRCVASRCHSSAFLLGGSSSAPKASQHVGGRFHVYGVAVVCSSVVHWSREFASSII